MTWSILGKQGRTIWNMLELPKWAGPYWENKLRRSDWLCPYSINNFILFLYFKKKKISQYIWNLSFYKILLDTFFILVYSDLFLYFNSNIIMLSRNIVSYPYSITKLTSKIWTYNSNISLKNYIKMHFTMSSDYLIIMILDS